MLMEVSFSTCSKCRCKSPNHLYFQMYSEGSTAVKQDNETAFQWFKKAADAVSE